MPGVAISRLIKTPKLHIGDTGITRALLGVNANALLNDRAVSGQLLETFVFQELRQQTSWRDDDIRFHHFRDKDDYEVDMVLERGAGQIAGVEVKASATVTARGKDLRPVWCSTTARPALASATACGRSRSGRCGKGGERLSGGLFLAVDIAIASVKGTP